MNVSCTTGAASPTSSKQPTYLHTYMQRPCRAKVKHRRLICLLGPEDEHPGSLLYLSGRGLLLNTNFHSVGFDACILFFFLPPPTEVILRLSYPLQDRAREPSSLLLHSCSPPPLFIRLPPPTNHRPLARSFSVVSLPALTLTSVFRRRLKNIPQSLSSSIPVIAGITTPTGSSTIIRAPFYDCLSRRALDASILTSPLVLRASAKYIDDTPIPEAVANVQPACARALSHNQPASLHPATPTSFLQLVEVRVGHSGWLSAR
ncbi:hypothetical protein B0J15DRAFT_177101 [Fusarium solani]|uniref:Uncharacterized protein n=1 Tax=Fusarium solani TaxID=169388 RepID=A0A9P9L1W0_FUSSL|nr:uncharacterized protein B0J15DRAFT_177101 [Fusarium solani]KAH7272420.1 hypothetical protein B0J15DRAFT_177101 [Fusarium solani]